MRGYLQNIFSVFYLFIYLFVCSTVWIIELYILPCIGTIKLFESHQTKAINELYSNCLVE